MAHILINQFEIINSTSQHGWNRFDEMLHYVKKVNEYEYNVRI